MKKWETRKDGNATSYHLTKEADKFWYAIIFMVDARWTFNIGRRVTNDNTVKNEHYHSTEKWKSLSTAKKKAIDAIVYKTNQE